MDSNSKLYLERSENEINQAELLYIVTNNQKLQREVFHLDKVQTFYSGVIAHSYYSIFYGAKAYLLAKGIRTKPPSEHIKTYVEFKKLVRNGVIDKELLNLYEEVLIKAETLLGIFRAERKKRGKFTYQRIAQANKEPAEASMRNSKLFFKHIYNICKNL